MNISVKGIMQAAGLVTAMTVLGGAAWQIGEVTQLRPALIKELKDGLKIAMDQTQINTLAIAKQEFDQIEGKIDHGAELTYEEKRDFCKNAQILDYPVLGCDSKTGEPNLIKRSAVK